VLVELYKRKIGFDGMFFSRIGNLDSIGFSWCIC